MFRFSIQPEAEVSRLFKPEIWYLGIGKFVLYKAGLGNLNSQIMIYPENARKLNYSRVHFPRN